MEHTVSNLSHEEVQEVAEYLRRFAARRSDDAGMAFAAKHQASYELALVEWKRAEKLLDLMRS